MYTLSDLAQRLSLTWEGHDTTVSRPALVEDTEEGSLTLATSSNYADAAAQRGAAALLLPPDVPSPLPCIRAENPRLAFARILSLFDGGINATPGAHPTAVIAESATVDPSASIGPHVVVESGASVGAGTRLGAGVFIGRDAIVGSDCRLSPGARVLRRCRLGNRVRLESGAVIGSEGFGYEWDGACHVRVHHIGTVVVEDDVDIGANTTVDRAKTGETRIGQGAKIDNLVQIGHGARIGPHCLIVAQVGISGSVVLEPGVVLAGQSGVADNVTIGAQAIVAAQSGVTKDLPGGRAYMGMPARPANEARRAKVAHDQLPEIVRRVRALEKKML